MTVCGEKLSAICTKCQYIKRCSPIIWDKYGKIDNTNEQWFDMLSTEEKAKFLEGLITYCFGIGHITESECEKYKELIDDVEKWLKSPHKE